MDVLGGGTSFGIQSAVTECVSAMQISNQLFWARLTPNHIELSRAIAYDKSLRSPKVVRCLPSSYWSELLTNRA